jgi:hypothetical protein
MPGSRTISSYTQTFNSFSGADMQVMFHDVLVGELQGLSYTITREKAPLYTMGSPNARSFSRGKRGIAGSLIFLTFDRSAIISALRKSRVGRYAGWEYETADKRRAPSREDRYKGIDAEGTVGTFVQRQDGAGSVVGNRISTSKVLAFPQYADQIMPFTIVVYAANEYGHSARMKIHNVEIMNAGSGMSVDDITTDESCTFVATDIEPWSDQMYIGADGSVVQLSENDYDPGVT